MSQYRLLDLFSGIGGFSLGLERTGGFKTVAFCEIDKAAQRVLNKHWPEVPCYDDIRELSAERLAADGVSVDCIVGGFPCQDISFAGRGAGLAGERSGLWFEFARLIGELEPRYVIVENVSALLSRGLGDVLGTLASLGYDAEWHCIPACAVGAPHRRDRIWIVAHPNGGLHSGRLGARQDQGTPSAGESRDTGEREAPHGERVWAQSGPGCEDVAHSECVGSQGGDFSRSGQAVGEARAQSAGSGSPGERPNVADPKCWRLQGGHEQCAGTPAIVSAAYRGHRRGSEFGAAWRSEPDVGRVAYGIPAQVDRLKQLGNAVVPQIPELIGRAILASEAA